MESTTVGIREAKIHLSKLVKLVKNGNEVVLTERGRPVVKMVPAPAESLSLEERVHRLEDRGIIERKHGKSQKKIPMPIPVPDDLAQRYLEEDRSGRK